MRDMNFAIILIIVFLVIGIGFITVLHYERTREPDLITEGVSVKKDIVKRGGYFIGKVYQPSTKEYMCYFHSFEMNKTFSIEYSISEWKLFKENEKYNLYFTKGKITGVTHLVKVEKK